MPTECFTELYSTVFHIQFCCDIFHPMMIYVASNYTIAVTYSVDSGFQSTKPVTFLPSTSSGLKINIIDPSSK